MSKWILFAGIGGICAAIGIVVATSRKSELRKTEDDVKLDGIESLQLRTSDVEVELIAAQGTALHTVLTQTADEDSAVRCSLTRTDVTVELDCRRPDSGLAPGAKAHLQIQLPQPFGGSLSWELHSGKGNGASLEADTVELDINASDLTLGTIKTGAAEIVLASGKAAIGSLDALDTDLDMSAGELAATLQGGAMQFTMNSGKARLDFARLNQPVQGDVAAGELELALAGPFSLALETTIESTEIQVPGFVTTRDEDAMDVQKIIEGHVGSPSAPRLTLAVRAGRTRILPH